MSSKVQKKEEVKKNFRFFFLLVFVVLIIDELKCDYYDFIMEFIFFRVFGYVIIEDFFKDMLDVLYVIWKKGVMCVVGIVDFNIVYIQKLVSKQKVVNKNKWVIFRKGGLFLQRYRIQ